MRSIKSTLLLGSIIAIIISLLPFCSQFKNYEISKWGNFGDYLSGTIGVLLSSINIFLLVQLTKYTFKKEDSRLKLEFLHSAYLNLMQAFEAYKADATLGEVEAETYLDMSEPIRHFIDNYSFLFDQTGKIGKSADLEDIFQKTKKNSAKIEDILLLHKNETEWIQSELEAKESSYKEWMSSADMIGTWEAMESLKKAETEFEDAKKDKPLKLHKIWDKSSLKLHEALKERFILRQEFTLAVQEKMLKVQESAK